MYNFYYPCYNIFIEKYILSLWKQTKSDPSPPPTQQSGICAHNMSDYQYSFNVFSVTWQDLHTEIK